MARHSIQWHRIFAIQFIAAIACLIAAACLAPPMQNRFLAAGVMLAGAFVPIVLAIYFMRGYRGSL